MNKARENGHRRFDKRRIALTVLCVLIVLTLVFIFSNSLHSKADSKSASTAVGNLIRFLLDPEYRMEEEAYQHLVRKLAHFIEFFALGCELAALWFLRRSIPPSALLFGALASAVADETIQMFSDRGDSVSDILLDFSGALTGMLVTFLICIIITAVKKKGSARRSGK